jgi:hypothetical protein
MLPSQTSRAMLTQIMVEVQTEQNTNAISGFLGELKDMLNKLVDAQAKHKVVHAKMMKQCAEEDLFRESEIVNAKASLAKALASRTRCKASLEAAQKALPVLLESHKTYSEELQRGRDARNIERKKFLERKQEFAEAIEFLADFMTYVAKKLKGSFKAFGFIEMSETLLKHATRLNVVSHASPILVALASSDIFAANKAHDYTYSANEDLATKLNKALNDLFQVLEKDNKTNEETEKKAAEVFALYEAKLSAIINTLAINIKRTQKQIQDMLKCIATEDTIIAEATMKLGRNTTLRDNARRMCKSFNGEFIEATLNRLDEIQTMKDILVIVHKRFANLPKDLVAYLESIKSGFEEYVNSTEFKAFVEYERIQHKDNVEGKELQNAKDTDAQLAKAITDNDAIRNTTLRVHIIGKFS